MLWLVPLTIFYLIGTTQRKENIWWYKLFLTQEKYIICMLWCRGRTLVIYICYNPFYAGGEHILVIICFLQGEFFYRGSLCIHTLSSSKRERMFELILMITFVMQFVGALSQKLMMSSKILKTTQGYLAILCILLKALKHTHFSHLVDLYPCIVDLYIL